MGRRLVGFILLRNRSHSHDKGLRGPGTGSGRLRDWVLNIFACDCRYIEVFSSSMDEANRAQQQMSFCPPPMRGGPGPMMRGGGRGGPMMRPGPYDRQR